MESEKFDEVFGYKTQQQMISSGDYGTEDDILMIIEEKVRRGFPHVRQHPDNPRNPHPAVLGKLEDGGSPPALIATSQRAHGRGRGRESGRILFGVSASC